MSQGGLRQFEGRRAMREGHRTQCRIAHRRVIELQHGVAIQRPGILGAQAHEKIVGMLRIHQRLAIGAFPGLKEQRVARLVMVAGSRLAMAVSAMLPCPTECIGGDHEPVRGIEFVAAARSALLRVQQEGLPHEHEIPGACLGHGHRHLPGIGIHGGAGRHIHEIAARAIEILVIHAVHLCRRRHRQQGAKRQPAKTVPVHR